ncbi:MAG: endo alpha-1,4 polygalactosaminidase [Planctomycetota bacterium]|nr:endo alpha-1,4 polygalactosaminidase [Planctomycetota bacterium]
MSPRVLVPSVILAAAAALGLYALLADMPGGTPEATRRDEVERQMRALAGVRSWVYQLQGLDREGAVDRLVRSNVDLYVLEATDTVRGQEDFPTRGVVKRLQSRAEARPLVLGYLNVGQAEDYRAYWQEAWRPKERTDEGRTSFVLCPDPEGWKGNFPVAYWDPGWRPLLFGSSGALLDRMLDQGFDGVYLDWVLGYADPVVMATAKREGVDPTRAMAELVRDLRAYARESRPGFLVVVQNPGDLIDRIPESTGWFDGVAQEGLVFQGSATDDWEAPAAGGRRRPAGDLWNMQALAALLSRYRAAGLPVFTADYAREQDDVAEALRTSRGFGFVPCVSRTPLDRVPEHAFEER